MKYHIIQTLQGTVRILEINSPSYALNLRELTILKEAKVDELPDVNCMDCWVINDDNTISISTEMQHRHLLIDRLTELKHATDAAFNPVFATYPQAEMQSWPAQEAEAMAWLADNTAPTPTLDALKPRGSKLDFCNHIVAKAEGFKEMLRIVVLSQRVRNDLKAMSLAELERAEPWLMLKGAITKAMK